MALKIEEYAGDLPSTRGRSMSADSLALVEAMEESLNDGQNKAWRGGGITETAYTKNVQKLAALAKRNNWRVARARVGSDLIFRAFPREDAAQPEVQVEAQPAPAKSAPRKAANR